MPLNPYGTRPLPMQPMVPQAPARVIVQQVNAIEPRTGPWSGNNELGRWVNPSVPTTRRQPLIQMAEWGEPCVRTLCVSTEGGTLYSSVAALDLLPTPTLTSTGSEYYTHVEVMTGIGGTTQIFKADIDPSMQVTIPCNTLKADVIYANSVAAGTARTDIQIAATIGKGPRASNAYSTLSEYIYVANGATLLLYPPPFAREWMIAAAGANLPQYQFINVQGRRLSDYAFNEWISLSGANGGLLSVQNNSGAVFRTSLIYRLGL